MRRLALLAGVLVLAGCSTTTTSQVTINVQSSAATNQRRPMYVVVRSVTQQTYLAEAYATVAGKVVTPDASVLDAEVVYPGVPQQIKVAKPTKDGVAVYFLFTDPGRKWKTLLAQPASSSVDIRLGDNQIDTSGNGD